MPRVPQLDVPQVQRAALPNVKVDETISREAAGIGASAQERDKAIYGFAEKAKNAADQVAVLEAENELVKFENEFQYNPETGMYRKQGKDAFNLINVSKEEYGKKRAQITNDYLKNDVQRVAFGARAAQREQQFNKEVMNHVGVQIQKYDDQTTAASLELEYNKAIEGYQNPGAISLALTNQKKSILEFADRHGESTEQAQLRINKAESKVHYGVISRMLTNGDDITAEEYFKNNKQNIKDADDLKRAESELEIGSTRGFAQRFTDDVIKKGYDETRAYKEAEGIENPKKREAAEQRIDRVFSARRQAEQRQQEDIVNRLADKFDETGTLDDVSPAIINGLDRQHLEALKSHVDRNPVRDDGVMYYQLRQMAEDPKTREKFKNYDLTADFGNLSKENRNKLITIQNDLRSGKDKAGKELDGSLSDSQIMDDVFKGAGYKNKEEFARFRQSVDAEILKVKQEKGKNFLNNNEVREIANNLAKKKVIDDGYIWNTKKPLFDITVDDIPKKKRMMIEDALKAKGKPINQKNIIDLFLLNENKNEQ